MENAFDCYRQSFKNGQSREKKTGIICLVCNSMEFFPAPLVRGQEVGGMRGEKNKYEKETTERE